MLLDFVSLLAPIKVQQPAGKNLRAGGGSHLSLYHKLKDARMVARAIERQQLQGGELQIKADWEKVSELAKQILTTQSKDLEVASWLIEALLRNHGFAGLRDGFRLVRELIERYWDLLYPLPDEDGLITKIAPLAGLNGEGTEGTLITPIALIPLTEGKCGGPFALWQYQQAARTPAGAGDLGLIMQEGKAISQAFLQNLQTDLQAAIDEFSRLIIVLDEKCGAEAPPSSRILAQLNACLDCVKIITKDNINLPIPVSLVTETEKNTTEQLTVTSSETPRNNFFSTREEVLKTLLIAADFFRRTEPHSPLPYLLDRTVRWARMSWPDLLRELIRDEQAWSHVCNLTGIQPATLVTS
jgi:type VI secretion system protein ImpA